MSTTNTPSKSSSHAATPSSPASSTPSLPPPQTFDIIPPLHALLTRLVSQTVSQPDHQPLEPQHLATEASAIKIQLQKARMAVEALPDMERSISEQEEEIKELENRIVGQQEVLKRLSQAGREEDGDTVMRGS